MVRLAIDFLRPVKFQVEIISYNACLLIIADGVLAILRTVLGDLCFDISNRKYRAGDCCLQLIMRLAS